MVERLTTRCAAVVAGILPATAQAQRIPVEYAFAALIPIIALVLSVLLGWAARSVLLGLLHTVLVVVWVVLFGISSYYAVNDYLVWTPVVLLAAHTVLIVVLLILKTARRIAAKGQVDR